MKNTYELFVGIDISKGKADAAILSVSRDRNIKPKFLRKKLSFHFLKSEVFQFLSTVRNYVDSNCTKVTYAMEVTGIYSENLYSCIFSNLTHNECLFYLNTQYVNSWRKTHHISKSDPLDAQTIASLLIEGDHVKTVNKSNAAYKNGYTGLKTVIHRYYQLKKNHSQEINRLINQCDLFFPELQYIFKPKSAVFLAILSVYPTSYDIINASKQEVFDIAFKASKHHCSFDKIELLFDMCNDTLVNNNPSTSSKQVILNLVNCVIAIKEELKEFEKLIKVSLEDDPLLPILTSFTGCGLISAATIIAETIDIHRFKSADKFVSYIGISPKNERSGSSVEILGKISKRGSTHLRHAIYMVSEFARRHNPVLKHFFKKIKNGNKKRHKLAVVAVANKVARYIYSMLKNNTKFIIQFDHINTLPEDTRNTFFANITTSINPKERKQIYRYSNEFGEVFEFSYLSEITGESIA